MHVSRYPRSTSPAAPPRHAAGHTPRHAPYGLLLALILVLAACGTQPESERVAELEAALATLEGELERLRVEAGPVLTPDGPAPVSPTPVSPTPTTPETASPEPTAGQDPAAASPFSEEGLVQQLHALARPVDPALGHAPAAAPFEPSDIPEGFAAGQSGYATPGELVVALAAELGADGLGQDAWEIAARVLHEDPGADTALGAVLVWGFADDSVGGSTLLLSLARGDGGWHVTQAHQRAECRRGVTEDGLCS
jgi:hypothetical protein